ncbi:unnamed protein product [Prunus armeniaca]
MPSYGKFLKDILSKKRRLDDTETVKLIEECSAAIKRQLPPKQKDPGSRPFLITGRTLIDVEKSFLILQVADQEVEFKVFDATKYPIDSEYCFQLEAIDHVVQRQFNAEYLKDPLEASLVNEIEIVDEEPRMLEMVNLLEATPLYKQPFHREFEPLGAVATKPVPSIVAAPTLTLKPLPSHLKYAYLGTSQTLPIIINSDLLEEEEEKLLQVLKKHKTAIGWTIADIKGISPSTCMHRIFIRGKFQADDRKSKKAKSKYEGSCSCRISQAFGCRNYLSNFG